MTNTDIDKLQEILTQELIKELRNGEDLSDQELIEQLRKLHAIDVALDTLRDAQGRILKQIKEYENKIKEALDIYSFCGRLIPLFKSVLKEKSH